MRNRMLVLAVVTLLAVGVAWAGGGKEKAGKMSPAEHAAKLQARLGLTDAQTAQVEAIVTELLPRMRQVRARIAAARNELKTLRGDPNANPAAIAAKEEEIAAIKAEKKSLKEERAARLKAILTAEQLAAYQQMMAEHTRKRGKH